MDRLALNSHATAMSVPTPRFLTVLKPMFLVDIAELMLLMGGMADSAWAQRVHAGWWKGPSFSGTQQKRVPLQNGFR